MRSLVRWFDGWLSRRNGIFEFSQDPDCILRLQTTVARQRVSLPDCLVEPGDPVLLLHLWNERLLILDIHAAGLGGAKTIQRSYLHSLAKVAHYLEDHPELANVRAVGGITILIGSDERSGGARLAERLGFTVLPYHSPLGGFGEFWENFYSWVLIWTYNPATLPNWRFASLQHKEFWMSAGEFHRRFGRKG